MASPHVPEKVPTFPRECLAIAYRKKKGDRSESHAKLIDAQDIRLARQSASQTDGDLPLLVLVVILLVYRSIIVDISLLKRSDRIVPLAFNAAFGHPRAELAHGSDMD
ncbi:hypothetical protein [Bifidobacterium pullorum]|uniref:hypothetical protein n=1 Tax=Bifidobacterium pullorum TaxID=78448 RepID=UPI003A925BDD